MEIPEFTRDATFGETLGPAMAIDNQEDADAYLAALLAFSQEHYGQGPEEAGRIHRENLGYWAGYYDNDTRERVERLFGCAHPVFGAIAEKGAPTPEEAFAIGVKAGETLTPAD